MMRYNVPCAGLHVQARLRDIALMFAFLLFHASSGVGAPSVSFPLEGFCRVGRYMPVVVTSDQPTALSLSGAVGLEIQPDPTGKTLAPWLIVGAPGNQISISIDGATNAIPVRLTVLREDQRLVGFTGQSADVARDFFPRAQINPIRLSAADPLPGPPAAWEALDMLVLDVDAVQWLTPNRLAGLLAAGTAVAVQTPDRPPGPIDWRRQGEFWIAGRRPIGPGGAVSLAAYSPSAGWRPGWPIELRYRVFWILVLFSIFVVGIALWRWRHAAVLGALLSLLAAGGGWGWLASRPAVAAQSAEVLIDSAGSRQVDRWIYQQARRAGDAKISAAGLLKPIFPSSPRLDQPSPYSSLRLRISRNDMVYTWRASPNLTLAFLDRRIDLAPQPLTPRLPVLTPMRAVARDLYVQEGIAVVGQITQNQTDGWDSIVLGQLR